VNLCSAITIPKALRYGQCVTRNHTATTIWLVLIAFTHERMARRSWPGWMVTYRDKHPAPEIKPGHGHPSQY